MDGLTLAELYAYCLRCAARNNTLNDGIDSLQLQARRDELWSAYKLLDEPSASREFQNWLKRYYPTQSPDVAGVA